MSFPFSFSFIRNSSRDFFDTPSKPTFNPADSRIRVAERTAKRETRMKITGKNKRITSKTVIRTFPFSAARSRQNTTI